MKKIIDKMKVLLSICLIGIIMVSCEKSEDPERNYLKIDGVEYNLSSGLIQNYGADGWSRYYGYNTDLILYSDGLEVELDEDGELIFVGVGEAIYFEMFSSSETYFDEGNYIYSDTQPHNMQTFDYGGYSLDFKDGQIDHNVVDGIVNFEINGFEYTITINCTGASGESITGFYKGTLISFDMTFSYSPEYGFIKPSLKKSDRKPLDQI